MYLDRKIVDALNPKPNAVPIILAFGSHERQGRQSLNTNDICYPEPAYFLNKLVAVLLLLAAAVALLLLLSVLLFYHYIIALFQSVT